jgi:hypothetical protein
MKAPIARACVVAVALTTLSVIVSPAASQSSDLTSQVQTERDLEQQYVALYIQKGVPSSMARQMVLEMIQACKAEAQREGTARMPSDYGDKLLADEGTNQETARMLAVRRREGVTDADVRWWWNMSDLERRILRFTDNTDHMTIFTRDLRNGLSEEEAAAQVRRTFPMYGDPDDTTHTSGDDRPLPYELKDRVNKYIERRSAADAAAYREALERATTFNALVRQEIQRGAL